MKILIAGGTGFIGGFLREMLLQLGHDLILVTRNPKKYSSEKAKNQQFISWENADVDASMEEADVVINLAGENIFGSRWTDEQKERLINSRVEVTRQLVQSALKAKNKPELFISASAAGYYGDTGDNVVQEGDKAGDDFLAQICVKWEAETEPIASNSDIRLATPRIGIVLHPEDGALAKMILPFKLFAGGPIGSGDQYIPWIHIHDAVRAIVFPIENKALIGPYNVCAPNAVTNKTLSELLGATLNRPSWIPVPEFALRIILGEAADPVLESLNVKPKVLQDNGFTFVFDDLELALADLV